MVTPRPNLDCDFSDPNTVPEKELAAEISASIKRLREYAFEKKSGRLILHTVAYSTRIQALLSRQADLQTQRIKHLTWGLLILTAALLLLTGYLSYDAYRKDNDRYISCPEQPISH